MKLTNEKDVILITCPVWGIQMPPLGLAYLATNLKKKGINLKVLDLNIEVYKRVDNKLKDLWKFENNKYWCDWDKDFGELFEEEIEYCLKRILSFSNTKICAFSTQATNRLFSIEIIKKIKRKNPDKVIIVGGTGCFDDKEREQIFPLELVDFFIVGEGEVSLFELINRLKKGIRIENIPGVVYYKNKEKRFTLPQLIEPLDKLYFPTYEEFDLEDYTEKSLALIMSRGCISRCAFCNDWKMMGKYRTRTAEHMFKEIKYHVKKNKITNFYFNDLLINGNIKELEKLCDLIIKSKYNLTWIALAIPLDIMNYNILIKMKKAGCITLNYGIESGSSSILKKIGKPISISSAEKVLELTRKAGINTQLNFIVGFPGEKEEDVEKTREFIKKNKASIRGVTNINICNVVAGSDISINSKKYGIIFPSEQRLRDSHWYTLDGNIFEKRKRRAENVISVLKDLNIPIFTTNLKEKVIDISEVHPKTKIVDIALVILPPWDIETPPVGLGYLAEYLTSKGINVKVFDFNIEFFNKFKEKYSYLWEMNNQKYWFNKILFKNLFEIFKEEIDSCVDKILSSNIKIVAFSVANPRERITIETIKKLKEKKPELKIILGGPLCNFDRCRSIFIENIPDLVDAYVIGEGEETLLEIIKAIENNEELEKIKGVITYKNGEYSKLIKRDPIDYKKIKIFPTYSKFDLNKYTNHTMVTTEWSRGCIGNCSFCQHKVIGGNYRPRTAENIVSEIKYHVRKNNIKYFSVCDSTINGDLKQLEKICDLIIKLGLKIKWSGLAIPRKMSYRLFKKLKKAGCYRLYYGAESGSNHILRLMRKIHSVNEAEKTLKLTHKAKIEVALTIIVGFPGETDEDFNKTLEFIRRNKDYINLVRSVNGLYIMDGVDIKENPKKYEIIISKDDQTGYNWYTNNGNNTEERNKKVKKVKLLLDELGIIHDLDSSFETEEINNLDKKKVILINIPPWGINNPPLGLACLSEYLKSNGIKVNIFDFNIELYNKLKEKYSNLWHVENKNYWSNDNLLDKIIRLISNDIEEWVNRIIDSNIGIIAFSVVDPKERLAIHMIKRIKEEKPESKVILGGPACATPASRGFFEERIPELIDAYIVGEGEESLKEVVNAINYDKPLKNIQGVIVFKNNKENQFIPRNPLEPKEIPSPTYNDFDLSQYGDGNSLLMEWSRGCIANCSFCIGKLMLGKYRFKEPMKIVEEIKYYVKEKGITNFTIVDNLINGNLKKLEETCDLIIKNNLKISWNCEGIGIEMPFSLLKKMKEAGCKEFQIGVESGSEVVLRRMRKPYTAKSAELLVRRAKNAGLKTEIFIMIGFPGETESEFNKTFEFIKRNKDYIDLVKSINILHLIAGTDVRDNYKKYGITLPKKDYYYKWYTKDSNMKIRNNRVKKMIDLINNLGIPFLETNIMEGKDKKSDNLRNIDNIITLELAKDADYDKVGVSSETEEVKRKRINAPYRKYKLTKYIMRVFLNIKNFFRNSNDINKIEQIRKKLIPTPKYVTIDLTNSCNLNCVGCWTHSPLLKDKEASKEWKSQMISFDTLKKLIDDLYDLGTERIRLTGGGEPFLYPKIFDVIKLIKEKGIACNITTNFTLLNKEKIKKLFELNVDELVVSLWAGDAETYVKTHPNQRKNAFEKVRENLRFIAQYKEKLRKGPKVIMSNVIMKSNYNKIDEMARFATNVSLDELYFTLVDPIKGRTDCLLLNNKERKTLLKKLNSVKKIVSMYNKKSRIHKIRIDDINRFINKIKSKKSDKGQYDLGVINKPCYIGYIFARILANGDVVPCCRAVMYPIGNINKKSFKDIWFSEEYDKFRERALYESKLNSYFKKIGCYTTCDNIIHNREIERCINISKNLKIKKNNIKKKCDIIFVICPPWSLSMPPLGASYITSFLKSRGISSKILDLNIILYKKDEKMQRYWSYDLKDEWTNKKSLDFLCSKFSDEIEKFISEAISTNCNLIGFSTYQNNIRIILRLAYEIKKRKPKIKIVIGGPSCSIKEERWLFYKSFIDFIVIGEGEETLVELIERLNKKERLNRLSSIPGLMVFPFKKKFFIERKPLDQKEMKFYRNDINMVKNYNDATIVPMFMSKGCICKCVFCNDRKLMGPYRVRPAEQVVEEIKYYLKGGINNLSFTDLLINGNIAELERFCDIIIDENITIHWTANALASENLTYEILNKIKKAGCDNLIFGIESGSNKVLNDMRKPIKIENCKRILKDCKKLNIGTWVNFIVGYPTESKEDFKKTIGFIEENYMFIDKILNANTCCTIHNCDMMLNKEKYNIITPDNDMLEEMKWYKKDGKNTLEFREKRLKILLKKAKYLGIPVEQTNLRIIDYYRKQGLI